MQKEDFEDIKKQLQPETKIIEHKPEKIDELAEADKKMKFVEEYNALIRRYGYDFMYKLQPPEIVKIEMIPNVSPDKK